MSDLSKGAVVKYNVRAIRCQKAGPAELPTAPPPLHFKRVDLQQHLTFVSQMASPQRLKSQTSTRGVPDKPWHAYITIDLLAAVLARSVFHPFIAWLIPLCLRSLSYPSSHPYFLYSCAYAAGITLFALLCKLDKRLAWGPPRKINWDEEVVVITGGAGGLGRVLAQTYSMRGVSVAVLDIREPEEAESEGMQNVRFYQCDVSKIEEVRRAKEEIEKDVRRHCISLPNLFQFLPPPLISRL